MNLYVNLCFSVDLLLHSPMSRPALILTLTLDYKACACVDIRDGVRLLCDEHYNGALDYYTRPSRSCLSPSIARCASSCMNRCASWPIPSRAAQRTSCKDLTCYLCCTWHMRPPLTLSSLWLDRLSLCRHTRQPPRASSSISLRLFLFTASISTTP